MANLPQSTGAVRTRTVPEMLQGSTFEGPKVVTSLLMYGTDVEYDLSPIKKRFTLGALPARDISIRSPFVSGMHCRLDRKLLGLRVTDEGSKNGTYFEGEREKAFYLRPGKMFAVGARMHRLLALNDEMRACYPMLTDILGKTDPHATRGEMLTSADLIIAAVHGTHLLITSEPECDQVRLAQIVHAISRLKSRPMVEIDQVPDDQAKQHDLLRRAARSTLVVDLGSGDVRLPASFVTMMFSSKYQVRVIALVRSIGVANEVLSDWYLRQMQPVLLRPIARRPEAVHRLLDRMFVERNSPLRVFDMTAENQCALRTYSWPDNFASLRQAADRLTSITAQGSIRKAAHELAIPPATLYHWYSKIMGLSRPLVRSAELS